MAVKEIKPAGLIAVMGGTGTGKSSFINAIVGKDVTDVGHSLKSQTSDIKEYDFLMKNGLHVTLVDTPGFNDSGGKSDLVILKEIGAFLKAKYNEDRKFSGILYLHNICDPKVGGSLQRNMTMFKKLCGPDPLKNVVVVTTFWDEIEPVRGIEFETELKTKDKFFKGLVEGKSKFVRYGKFPPGEIPKGSEFLPPISIVSELVALDPVFVEMQKELAEGKTVEQTSAGAELYKELQQLKLQQKKDVIDLNKKIGEMKAQNIKDRLAREALEDESHALKGQIKEWEARQHELHLAVRSGRSEWAAAIAQLKQEKETSVKQRDLELENSRQVELRSEIELLKTLHAKEILECQFQIRSLLDGNSIDAFRKTQLEKTCEDLKATVSDLSLSLTRLRDTNEREAVEHIEVMRQCNQLRANAVTHKKTLDDLAEARSNIAHLKSQLQASQAAQGRTMFKLEKLKSTLANVKDGAEIAATTHAKTLSELNAVRAALADAERNFVASQNTQENTASELREARLSLEKMRSELSAAHGKCEETESQLRGSRSALERMKLELVKAKEASPSPSPWESRSNATPKLPGMNGIPEGGEGEEESVQSPPSLMNRAASLTTERPPWPRRRNGFLSQLLFHSDIMDASCQQPVTSGATPVHPDSRAQRPHFKSQLQASRAAQERTVSELDEVKSTLSSQEFFFQNSSATMAMKEIKPACLIAVMGGTGTGKSSFINAIVGMDVTDVGRGLESQTSEIKEYDFLMKNGLHVTLLDTPGFNDYTADTGGKSDLFILKEIGAFLKAKYDEECKLSGILYLHNICDPKVGGSLQRNMTMFKKLCGPDPLKNVVIVTTFWDEIELLQGIEFETELKTKDKFFKGLVEGKSKFVRYGKFSPGEIPKGPEFLPPISIVSKLVALHPKTGIFL